MERALVERAARATGGVRRDHVERRPRLLAVPRLILRDAGASRGRIQETLLTCSRDLATCTIPTTSTNGSTSSLSTVSNDEFNHSQRQGATIAVLRVEPSRFGSSAGLAARDLLRRGFQRLSVDNPDGHRPSLLSRPLHRGDSRNPPDPGRDRKSRLQYATEAMRLALKADARPTGEGGQRMNTRPDIEKPLYDSLDGRNRPERRIASC